MKPAAYSALEDLRAHREAIGNPHLRDLFAADPERFARFSLSLGDLTLDYSKNRIVPETMPLLVSLAERAEVAALRDAMFAGAPINITEKRAVLHVALRAPPDADIRVDGRNVVPDVHATLDRFTPFRRRHPHRRDPRHRRRPLHRCRQYRHRRLRSRPGDGGRRAHALSRAAGRSVHFVSNVDGAHLADTLAGLDAERTLFLVASKTFTTSETMTNAASARAWLAYRLGEEAVPSISPPSRPI